MVIPCRIFTLFISSFVSSTFAEDHVFTFPPPAYQKTCEQHQGLVQDGLTVKADRLRDQYRKKHLSAFLIAPGEKKVVKINSPGGFKASYQLADYVFESAISNLIVVIWVPPKDLEKWQDVFKDAVETSTESGVGHFDEITLRIKVRDRRDKSPDYVVSDCFDSPDKFEINSGIGNIELVGYKRKGKSKSPQSQSRSAEVGQRYFSRTSKKARLNA